MLDNLKVKSRHGRFLSRQMAVLNSHMLVCRRYVFASGRSNHSTDHHDAGQFRNINFACCRRPLRARPEQVSFSLYRTTGLCSSADGDFIWRTCFEGRACEPSSEMVSTRSIQTFNSDIQFVVTN